MKPCINTIQEPKHPKENQPQNQNQKHSDSSANPNGTKQLDEERTK